VVRRYILEDLRFHPISACQFGKYVTAAMSTLVDMMEDRTVGDYTPCVSNVMLKDQASDVLLAKEQLHRSNLVSALCDDPAVCDLMPAGLLTCTIDSPLQWTPRVTSVDGISEETVAEQNAAL